MFMTQCTHYWKFYMGLNESFSYCGKCDIKEDEYYDQSRVVDN